MARGGIRLHKKHGLNPTMVVCNWCGRSTGEIALLGASYEGEAPKEAAIDDMPCEKCKAEMAKGILFVEYGSRDAGSKRTGRWCVVKEEAVRRIIHRPALDSVLKKRAARITPDVARELGLFEEQAAP